MRTFKEDLDQAPAMPDPTELTDQEFIALLEERVQAKFGMSLDDFVKAIRSGALDLESASAAQIALLAGA